MKNIGKVNTWIAGIADDKKLGEYGSFAYGRSIDFRSKRSELTVNPKTVKISGSTVVDLPMWFDLACDNLYPYGNTGKVYRIDENDAVVVEHTVPDSVGNGMAYLPEDKNLYLASNHSMSRRTNACGDGDYTDNFLEAEGGEPTNPKSLSLVAASSQSATRTDTASLSITGDLTLEAYIKPTSLPTTNNQMTLISKWEEDGTLRSYKMSIVPVSNDFGDGSAGALTISSNTTQAPIDSACSGTSGTKALSATNASFATGQKILIIQMRGTGAGTKQKTTIQSYTSGTITTEDNLTFSFNSTGANKAQVIVLPQYSAITIDAGFTWSAKAWDGTVGGVLVFLCSGTLTRNGTISANECGFRGAAASASNADGKQGEGTGGAADTVSRLANGNGGGGGQKGFDTGAGGGSGGNATAGTAGNNSQAGSSLGGVAGEETGSTDLTTITMGGGGGSGGGWNSGTGGAGGRGGGIIYGYAVTYVSGASGSFTVLGGAGSVASGGRSGGNGGPGASGSILLNGQVVALGTSQVIATSVAGTTVLGSDGDSNASSEGRIRVNYATSLSGTTTPTMSSEQDTSLSASDGYAIRLYISSDGDNSETYTMVIDDPEDFWGRFQVAWDASASTAYFYRNGILLGTRTGAFTEIDDNGSEFGIGAYTNSGSARTGFYDGLIDDVRVWSVLRSESQLALFTNKVLTGAEEGLVAYYQYSDNLEDAQTSGNNDLTGNNTPTYSTDVPFSGVTTRLDEDVFDDATGQTYTLLTSLSEADANRHTFVPTKEPLKSIVLEIDTVGTGNWTVKVHDSLNREIATVTVPNAELFTGEYEFVFDDISRPILNASYHIHVYSTVADGEVVTGTTEALETAFFKSFFQILVDDEYHPMAQFINFLAIGNERYLAIYEAGNIYNPHRLILPSGYRIRSLAFWREYLVLCTTKGDEITDTDIGKVFFWDGTSDTYVEPLSVPQGGINAAFGAQGTLYMVAGYEGKLLEYTGGDEAGYVEDVPEISNGDYVDIAPGSMTMWRGILYYGIALNTNSTTIHQGVYGYGRSKSSHPKSLGFDHPLSIGDSQSSMVKVGGLYPRGRKLYIGFQNSNSYGIDVVDAEAEPYPTSRIELLTADLGSVPTPKLPLVFRADHRPLESGQSITLYYRVNQGAWNTLTTQTNTDATETRGNINHRVKEIDLACDIGSTTTAPKIIEFTLDADLESEGRRA